MKKMSCLLLVMFFLALATVAVTKAVYLVGGTQVDAEYMGKYVRFTWKFSDTGDMWANNQVMYYPDPIRDQKPGFEDFVPDEGNVPFPAKKTGTDILYYDIPTELIQWGQSALNLADNVDWFNGLWLGLPDCGKLHVGKNLVLYRSVARGDIPHSGGMHLLYVGPGAPFVPKANDPMLYQCGGNVAQATAPPVVTSRYVSPAPTVAPAPVVAQVVKSAPAPVKKKTVADAGCTTCEKEIITKVDAVKVDTGEIRESVGDVDKTEPVEEQTIQKKTRIILAKTKKIDKAVGEGKTDHSLHQKIGEPSKPDGSVVAEVEQTNKMLGQPKDPKETLTQIVEETRDATKKSGFAGWQWALLGAAVIGLIWLVANGVTSRRRNNRPNP